MIKGVILAGLLLCGSAFGEIVKGKFVLDSDTSAVEMQVVEKLAGPEMLASIKKLIELGKVVEIEFFEDEQAEDWQFVGGHEPRPERPKPAPKERCRVKVTDKQTNETKGEFVVLRDDRKNNREIEYEFEGPCGWVQKNLDRIEERLREERIDRP